MAELRSGALAEEKKRAGPPEVAPINFEGVRYEVLPFGKARGLEQNGGYIAAYDATDGRELWIVRIYQVDYDPAIEADKQDVFITAMTLVPGPSLSIEDELGRSYLFDIRTHGTNIR